MNKIHEWVNTGLIVLVAVLVLVGGNQSDSLGASGTRFPNGLSTDTTSPAFGEVRTTDLTVTDDATITDDLTVSSDTTVSGATVVSTFTQGGGIRSTSTSLATATLLDTDFDVENYIKYTVNGASNTLTFPASSTLTSFIPTAGQCRNLVVENATGTAGITLTIAVGTGWDFHNSTSTLVIVPTASAFIHACRNDLTDIEANVLIGLP